MIWLSMNRTRSCAKRPSTMVARLLLMLIIIALLAVPFVKAGYVNPDKVWNAKATVRSPENTGTSVVAAFDTAMNAHDSAAALLLFADDATMHDLSNIACLPGPPPFCGGSLTYTSATEIRGWLDQLVKENIQVKEQGNFSIVADNVTWSLDVSVDEYRRLNVAPLLANAQATIHEGKIEILTIGLDQESTRKLALGYAASERTPYAILASGIGFGMFILGLVFPAAAAYYISRVKSLFAAVPGLERPWVLLQAGVSSLFVAVLLVGIGSQFETPPPILNIAEYLVVVLTGFFILVAMVLMKRVWADAAGN